MHRYKRNDSKRISKVLKAITASSLICLLSSTAWAVYPQKMILSGDGASEIPSTSISFSLPDGSKVPVQDDEDDGELLIVFPGDSPEPGTLLISLPDGTIKTIDVPRPRPDNVLLVNVVDGTATFRPDAPGGGTPGEGSPATVFIFGGYMDMDLPPVGAGTLITGGSEDFATMLDDSVDMPFGGGGVAFPAGPGMLMLYGAYGEGDDRAANSTPPGGAIDVGIVFTDRAPSGSTGLFLGNAGLDTRVMRNADAFRLGGVYSLPVGKRSPESQFSLRAGLEYQRIEQTVSATVTSPTFGPAISATYDQQVDDSYVALIAGGEYRSRQPGGFIFSFSADGLLISRDASLESLQRIMCTLCTGADRDFSVILSDDDDGITFGARGRAEIGVELGGKASVAVGGFVEYVDKVSQIVNPRTGDDLFVRNQPTAIRTQNSTTYGGMATLRIGF